MQIGIAYDLAVDPVGSDSPEDQFEEFDSPATVAAVSAALESCGHRVRWLGGGRQLVRELLDQPPDLLFNMAEGSGTRSREAHVPALCELLGVPHTHSDPLTLAASLDKSVAKRLLAQAGVPTPRWTVITDAHEPVPLDFPVLAKPVSEGSSIGIRLSSRHDNPAALAHDAERLLRDYGQPVLVEEFCPGSELTVGIIGSGAQAKPLGVMEIIPLRTSLPQFVYSLEVKRQHESFVSYEVPPRHPLPLVDRAVAAALGAHQALGCRDVARIDLRLDADGQPAVLDVNPLPGLRPGFSDIVILAERHGVCFEELIGQIVASARARQGI